MEKARTEEPTTLKEMAEDSSGLPYHDMRPQPLRILSKQSLCNCLKNEKMTNIGTIKENEVFEDVLFRNIRRQLKGSLTEMTDKDTIIYDKTKSGEYALDRPPKKPGREEVDDINTATTITCDTSSDHESSGKQLPM